MKINESLHLVIPIYEEDGVTVRAYAHSTPIARVTFEKYALILAKVCDYMVFQIGNEDLFRTWDRYSALRFFAFGVLGLVIAVRKFPELDDLDKDLLKMGKKRGANIKILDTNVIIDGRVADVVDTHFLSGTLVVPRFVLTELHRLADSEDPLKRARGRRGLDVLARLQENVAVPVRNGSACSRAALSCRSLLSSLLSRAKRSM